ncbi:ABC transporter substrate-binding protein [Pseudooceanicola spongiae]|uniref:PhnD/SsuA/transferrin family substrate-binding protein n=1 Tax=Pseudooceanicola spongiae TaxID=2613965 RepID=A0A7L9WGT5_9RHOB|nr:ABC transporter substrate-binding protein [Pseudooceanicola spongiae]QOL79561.1 PhnD/SsuA/transferrin family substrate-binding protein [Pseudooceanicola spongiae]|tara:strand:- start:171 stop:1160 length:990 start_codon:yes stop_codon:yes gene_type:complete
MSNVFKGTVAALALLAAAPAAFATDKVTMQIDGAAVPFYAPLYAGVEQGFFADQDIEVEFIYAGASDILTNIAAGNVQFGFPNGDAVVAAVANGLPVKVVHTTYQRGIGALLAKADSGIETYADLKGKTVAVSSLGSPNYLQLQVGLKKAGLTLDDIKLEVVSTGAIVQALQSDQVDAIVFSELRKYNLEGAGVPVTMILSNDFLPSFGNVVVTSDKLLASDPDLVKRFTNAVTASYEWVIDGHVADALDISFEKYTPTWIDQKALLTTAFENSFVASVWQSDLTKEKGLGAADMDAWQANADTLKEYGVIDVAPKATDFVVDPSDIGK